jgi:hypothetical protein
MHGQDPLRNDSLESASQNRRAFIKKMAAVAFAVPVVGAFSMESVALAAPGHTFPGQKFPNQTFPNQTFPNQTFPNQTFPNQTFPSQTFPNQTFPNQTRPAAHDKGDHHKPRDLKRVDD